MGEHRRPAGAVGNSLRDRIGQVTNTRELVGLVLLAVGGTGMFVLELAVAIGDSSRSPLAIVLIGGSALCLLGAGLRKATGAQWFHGLVCLGFNAGLAYMFNDALCRGNLGAGLISALGMLLFGVGAALMLALFDPDSDLVGVGGGAGGFGGGDGGGGGGC